MDKQNIEQHVKILGWLHLISHAFFLVLGLLLWFLLAGIGVASGDADARVVLSLVGTFLGLMMAALSAPGLLSGYGLLQRKSWGRVLAIVVGALNLMNIPLGTILGVYTLYVLLPEPAGDYFAEAKLA